MSKSQAQLVGRFVEPSVNATASGAGPDVGVAENAATGGFAGGGVPPSGSKLHQYRLVVSLPARMTRPVVLLTFCLVDVASFMSGTSASRMIGVPTPVAKAIVPNGAVLS